MGSVILVVDLLPRHLSQILLKPLGATKLFFKVERCVTQALMPAGGWTPQH